MRTRDTPLPYSPSRWVAFFLVSLLRCSNRVACQVDEDDGTDAPSDGGTDAGTWYPTLSTYAYYYTIIAKITSLLSLMGSGAIIAEVLVERRKHSRRSSASIGWLLISMSISDISFTSAYFVGNWAVPSDTTYVWQPLGNTASCDAQGFFNQLGWAATPLFSLALSVYFLLIVRYNWTEGQLSKLNPWVHGSIWLLSLVMAVIPIPLEMYNDSYGSCWVEAKPYGCSPVDDDWPCTRGQQAGAWALAYFIFPALVCLLLSTIVMFMLYQTVRQMETDRMNNILETESGQELQLNTVDRKRSRRVGMQAIYYLSVCYLVNLPMFAAHIAAYINNDWYNDWTDLVVYAILLPLLGFFNFLVFASRREKMYTCFGRFLSRAVCCFGITGAVLRQSSSYFSRLSTGLSNLSSRIPSALSSRQTSFRATRRGGSSDKKPGDFQQSALTSDETKGNPTDMSASSAY